MELKVYKIHPDANDIKFQTVGSACFDIAYSSAGKHNYSGYSATNSPINRPTTNGTIHIMPHERILVPTGLILDIPENHSVRIHSRSGISLKNGLILANGEGVIDYDYTDELFVMLYNISDVGHTISNGDRIAQGELVRKPRYEIEYTLEKPQKKENRVGGLGSTGV